MRSRGTTRAVLVLGALAALVAALVVALVVVLLLRRGPGSSGESLVACADDRGDAARIQSAIDASSPGDGLVLRGRCLVTTTIRLLGDRSYRGASASTRLTAASGSNLPAVLASDSWLDDRSYTGDPISLRDLSVDANRAGNPGAGDAVVIRSWNSQIENLKIVNATGNGLTIAASSRHGTPIRTGHTQVNGTVSGVYVTDSGGNGIYAQEEPGDNALTDWNLTYCWVGGSGGAGIRLDNGAGWVVAHNHVYDDTEDGIAVERAFATSITGNNVEDFGAGHSGIRVTVQGDAASEISDNRVFQAQPDGGTTFIAVDGVVYGTGDVNVSGNVVRGNGSGVGLSYRGRGHPLLVTSTGNDVRGVATARVGVAPSATY